MPTFLSTQEVANRLGVTKNHITTWKKRYSDFPAPTGAFKRQLVWTEKDVARIKKWMASR